MPTAFFYLDAFGNDSFFNEMHHYGSCLKITKLLENNKRIFCLLASLLFCIIFFLLSSNFSKYISYVMSFEVKWAVVEFQRVELSNWKIARQLNFNYEGDQKIACWVWRAIILQQLWEWYKSHPKHMQVIIDAGKGHAK